MSSMMQCLLLGLLNLTRSPQLFNIFDTLSARRWYQQPFPITEMERHRVCEGSLWPWWLCQWHCRDQVWETHSYQGLYYSFTEHRSRILRVFFVICEIFRILYRFGFEIIHSLVFSFPELKKCFFFSILKSWGILIFYFAGGNEVHIALEEPWQYADTKWRWRNR